MFLTFNDNSKDRKLYYMALNTVLDITLNPKLELFEFKTSLNKMFGADIVNSVLDTISGKIKFYGLTKTNMHLEGIEKHLKLIESYKKLHIAKRNYSTK